MRQRRPTCVVASAHTAGTARAAASGIHLDGRGEERLREAGGEAGGAERHCTSADGGGRLRDEDDAADTEGDDDGDGGGRRLAQQPGAQQRDDERGEEGEGRGGCEGEMVTGREEEGEAGVAEGAPQEEEPLADAERAATCNRTHRTHRKLAQVRRGLETAGTAPVCYTEKSARPSIASKDPKCETPNATAPELL